MLTKIEAMQHLLSEVGADVEDMAEQASRETARYQGEVRAHQRDAQGVDGALKRVDREVDAGVLTLEQASHVKRHLVLLQRGYQDAAVLAEQAGLAASGAQKSLRLVVNRLAARRTKLVAGAPVEPSVASPEDPSRKRPLKARRAVEDPAGGEAPGNAPDAGVTSAEDPDGKDT